MSDTDLARQNQALKAHVDHQEKELVTLRHEALEQSDSRGAGGAGAGGAKDEQTRKLQSKVQRLQEELTDKLRLEVQGTTSQLNMSKEIQDLFQKWQLSRAEAEKLRTEVDGFRAREATLEAQAGMATRDLEIVQEELKRVRARLDTVEKECLDVRRQNEELVRRMVGEKSHNAEEMNRMTELVERMRAQLKARNLEIESTQAVVAAVKIEAAPSSGLRTDELPSHCSQQFRAHAADVNDLVYCETGQWLATAGGDGKVRVWEAESGRLKATLHGQDVMLGLDFRGDFVVGGSSDHTCKLWSLASGRLHRTFVGHSGNIYAVKLIAGDLRAVLTGGADRTIRLWDVGRASCRQVLRSGSTCNGLDIGLDGHAPVSAHQDGGLRFWDLRAGNPTMIVRAFETQATSVQYGQNFTALANSRDNALKIIDTRTFETLHVLRHEDYRTFLNWSRACFSPSSSYVAAGSATGQLFVWETASGETKSILSHTPDSRHSFSSSAEHDDLRCQGVSLSASGDRIRTSSEALGGSTSGAGQGGGGGGIISCAWKASRLSTCTRSGNVCIWN
jgi:autophagy-related protein 16